MTAATAYCVGNVLINDDPSNLKLSRCAVGAESAFLRHLGDRHALTMPFDSRLRSLALDLAHLHA